MTERTAKFVLTAEDRTRMAIESAKRNLGGLDDRLKAMKGVLGGAFSVAVVYGFGRAIVEAGRMGEQSMNRLTAVINAQGHAAGFTRKQLEQMNDELVASGQFDDDAIRNAQAQLLKFGNIYDDVFRRALKLSADLAAFQGTELSTAVDSVGKALQNPALGVMQLERQLGRLDPAQKETIKNLVEQNRVIEAQNKLLEIANGKIGGTAELMNSGYTKAVSDAAKAWDDLKEAISGANAVKSTTTSFLEFVTGSMKDLKSIIETGDWFAGLLFLLGGRGHISPNSQEGIEKRMESYRAQIKALKDLLDMSGVSEQVKANARKQLGDLETKLANEAETIRLMNRPTGKGGKNLVPTIDGEKGKGTTRKPIGEHVPNLLGFDAAFFQEQMVAQQFVQDALAKDKENVERHREILMLKADNAAFGRELMIENKEAYSGALKDVERYVAAVEQETKLMSATNREHRDRVDVLNLEAMGLVQGTKDWKYYEERVRKAREAQDALNESWEFGAQISLNEYLEVVRNVAGATEGLMTNAFRSMEDALVDFTMTGKLSFRDMAQSILRDIARIQVQQSITGPLAQALGGTNFGGTVLNGLGFLLGGSSTGEGVVFSDSMYIEPRAKGGPVRAGQPYLVGEEGPEVIVPGRSGTVVPNGVGGGVTVQQVFNISPGLQGAVRSELMKTMPEFKKMAVASVREARQRGGRV